MEIKDLAGLAEPLKKLVEVLAQGVGSLSKPYLIRKNADAKAYETKTSADAKSYEIKQLAESINEARQLLGSADLVEGGLVLNTPSVENPLSLPERIEKRKQYQEAKEQHNIEEITSIAAEELADEETVSSEPVDDDWIARFFDAARLINDEQMQNLWGKILAGEIKQPHSYSLRTLDLLRNLSKNEAEIFVKVARLAIRSENLVFVIFPDDGEYWEANFNISFSGWLILRELGLVIGQDLSITARTSPTNNEIYFLGDTVFVLEPFNDEEPLCNVKGFTTIGSELARLVDKEVNRDYLLQFATLLHEHGTVKYAKITEISPQGSISPTELQEFDFSATDSFQQ